MHEFFKNLNFYIKFLKKIVDILEKNILFKHFQSCGEDDFEKKLSEHFYGKMRVVCALFQSKIGFFGGNSPKCLKKRRFSTFVL